MRVACSISEATRAGTEICNAYSFPQQQWLRERASVLRHTYIACLVISHRRRQTRPHLHLTLALFFCRRKSWLSVHRITSNTDVLWPAGSRSQISSYRSLLYAVFNSNTHTVTPYQFLIRLFKFTLYAHLFRWIYFPWALYNNKTQRLNTKGACPI